MKVYYRADKRTFAVGDTIVTAAEYIAKFEGVARRIEDTLEARRPAHKAPRETCLFAFESLAAAKKHWSKMTHGKLYRVAIDEVAILHRGDMTWMDAMMRVAEIDSDWIGIADAYWQSVMSDSPEIEILAAHAVVSEVLSVSEQERVAHLKERWGFTEEPRR